MCVGLSKDIKIVFQIVCVCVRERERDKSCVQISDQEVAPPLNVKKIYNPPTAITAKLLLLQNTKGTNYQLD